MRPGYFYPFDHAMSPRWPPIHSARLLDASYRLSYRTMNKILYERVAEVLDGLRSLREKTGAC